MDKNKSSVLSNLEIGRSQNQPMGVSELLNRPFNGKPQASMPEFASACGSPLNEINEAVAFICDCHQHAASFQLSLL
jgi:hypothetical protein